MFAGARSVLASISKKFVNAPFTTGFDFYSGDDFLGQGLPMRKKDGTGVAEMIKNVRARMLELKKKIITFRVGPSKYAYTEDITVIKKAIYDENNRAKERAPDAIQAIVVGTNQLTTVRRKPSVCERLNNFFRGKPQPAISKEYTDQRTFYKDNLLDAEIVNSFRLPTQQIVLRHLSKLKDKPVKTATEFKKFIEHMVADSIAENILGIKDFHEREEVITLMEKAPAMLMHLDNHIYHKIKAAFGINFLQDTLHHYTDHTFSITELDQFKAQCHAMTRELLAIHRNEIKASESFYKKFQDTFSISYNSDEGRALAMFLLFGGHDSTSSAAFFTLLSAAICQQSDKPGYKQYYESMQQETHLHWNPETTALPGDRIAEMKTLDPFYRESVRLFPPFSTAKFELTEDLTLSEGTLPKGTTLCYSLPVYHRLKEVAGENADKFIPRFWDETSTDCRFLVWGSSPHNCPGRKKAELDGITILAMMIGYGFTFKVDPRLADKFPNDLPLLDVFSLKLKDPENGEPPYVFEIIPPQGFFDKLAKDSSHIAEYKAETSDSAPDRISMKKRA